MYVPGRQQGRPPGPPGSRTADLLSPASVDHTPRPHPASPSDSLPSGWGASSSSDAPRHSSFSHYRDHAQQFGPLRKTIRSGDADPGIGGRSALDLGTVSPAKGEYFDRNELPARFRRSVLTLAEIEAIETGGAALFA